MDARNVTGWVLVLGPLLFFVGAANPVLMRAWTAPRPAFLATVAAHPRAWRSTNLLMVAATIVTPAGLVLLAVAIGMGDGGGAAALALAGAVAFAIGSVAWSASLLHRLAVTPHTALAEAASGTTEPWTEALERWSASLYALFIVGGLAALAVIGVAAAMGGGPIPSWLGWAMAVLSGVLIGAYVRAGDMPPFAVYVPPFAFGVALLLAN